MRRAVDFAVSLLVLPVLSPLFVLVALAIVTESNGSPFYGGWRVGKGGKRFRMWKFRTMVKDADRMGGAITTSHDARVTRVGRLLRATKIDELPQFFNLLLGDLTLIGPRPETPSIVEQYRDDQREILKVKPGITGPVQLRYTGIEAEVIPDGHNSDKFYIENLLDTKLRQDLEYLKTRTWITDVRVVLGTVRLIARAALEVVQ
jgi:lipopolysaccharide/colanic/teichoic acid biosynthesis glycosyltransferase